MGFVVLETNPSLINRVSLSKSSSIFCIILWKIFGVAFDFSNNPLSLVKPINSWRCDAAQPFIWVASGRYPGAFTAPTWMDWYYRTLRKVGCLDCRSRILQLAFTQGRGRRSIRKINLGCRIIIFFICIKNIFTYILMK